MKISMLSTVDLMGGAYIVAFRLHRELRRRGIDSRMLVQKKISNDPNVIATIPSGNDILIKLISLFDQIPAKFLKTSNTILHSPAWVPEFTLNHIEKQKPNLVHLHWINSGFLCLESIARIRQPTVWTLHDMWAFCGAEHYADDKRYIYGYKKGNRPKYESGFDLNRWVWQRKIKAWKNLDNLTIVTPSHWLAEKVKESRMFKGVNVRVIPNGIDVKIFKPLSKINIRKKLNLPLDKKILLFGALSLEDKRKGCDLLMKIIKNLLNKDSKNEYLFLTFGSGNIDKMILENKLNPQHFINYGFVKSEKKMNKLYSSADLYLMTSRVENFPTTILESMSCGTPAIAFNVGGISDLIDNGKNGFLIEPFDTTGYSRSIEDYFSNKSKQSRFPLEARKKVVSKFNIQKVAGTYIGLYRSILG